MSELAAEKKRAEVVADESWARFQRVIEGYTSGIADRNTLEGAYLDFQLAHNTERGLRHEKV